MIIPQTFLIQALCKNQLPLKCSQIPDSFPVNVTKEHIDKCTAIVETNPAYLDCLYVTGEAHIENYWQEVHPICLALKDQVPQELADFKVDIEPWHGCILFRKDGHITRMYCLPDMINVYVNNRKGRYMSPFSFILG